MPPPTKSLLSDGQRYLGAAIGHRNYTATYVISKVQDLCNEVKHLAEIADIFHSCCLCSIYSWFVWSLVSPYVYYPDLLCLLEDVIHQFFIPALFGHPPCFPIERDLYALLACLGGLGLMNCSVAFSYFHDSKRFTASLVALIAAKCMNTELIQINWHACMHMCQYNAVIEYLQTNQIFTCLHLSLS